MRRGRIPLLVRRGGCGFNKKSRSHRKPAADGVVAHKPPFKNAFPSMVCERPPRPLHLLRLRAIALALRARWLRAIFLMSRPPLLTRRGMRLLISTLALIFSSATAFAQDPPAGRLAENGIVEQV